MVTDRGTVASPLLTTPAITPPSSLSNSKRMRRSQWFVTVSVMVTFPSTPLSVFGIDENSYSLTPPLLTLASSFKSSAGAVRTSAAVKTVRNMSGTSAYVVDSIVTRSNARNNPGRRRSRAGERIDRRYNGGTHGRTRENSRTPHGRPYRPPRRPYPRRPAGAGRRTPHATESLPHVP